jgi:hypothetical protein
MKVIDGCVRELVAEHFAAAGAKAEEARTSSMIHRSRR